MRRRTARQARQARRLEVMREAAADVVPGVITALSVSVVSLSPVFFLTGRDRKLSAPLAWTKPFALTSSLIVAVVVDPLLCWVLWLNSRMPRWWDLIVGHFVAKPAAGMF